MASTRRRSTSGRRRRSWDATSEKIRGAGVALRSHPVRPRDSRARLAGLAAALRRGGRSEKRSRREAGRENVAVGRHGPRLRYLFQRREHSRSPEQAWQKDVLNRHARSPGPVPRRRVIAARAATSTNAISRRERLRAVTALPNHAALLSRDRATEPRPSGGAATARSVFGCYRSRTYEPRL